ncbi:hypothetical protein OGAPHI_003081 [Ogataea philodendri]|uniref:Uncharacterized protein n=1 Tax=Ogataea philodendri TaxID=1378263 RepID=A0A9P8P8V3_9ASCO|nr:uncharacterized protein OGAPHI_003081 [Ogataea philodendri]KAH3667432.1 hypothetical protein OGAPHI_003081 [Ogataea philodendri]
MPAVLAQTISELVDVQLAGLERNNRQLRVSNDLELGDLLVNRLSESAGGQDDVLARSRVPVVAHVHHSGPGADRQCSGTGASKRRRSVQTSHPFGGHEVLVLSVLVGAVHDNGGALWSKAVLVGVATDGRDARESKVERL